MRDRLDPRLFARQQVEDRHLEAVPLRPPDVHPHQHLGPVLRLGAAGAGVDREQRVAAVLGALEHGLELERLDAAGELVGLPGHLGLHGLVGLGLEQLGHLDRALDALIQILVGDDPGLQGLESPAPRPGPRRGWPRSRPRPAALRARSGAPTWREGQRKSRSSVDPLLQLGRDGRADSDMSSPRWSGVGWKVSGTAAPA